MSTQKATVVHFPLPINSRSEGVAFLVAEQRTDGIRIRQSKRYGGKLNRFWTVWLRDVLMKAPDKYELTITTSDSDVSVTSTIPTSKWIWAIVSLAATVVPIPNPPIGRDDKEKWVVGWRVYQHADLKDIVKQIKLPDAAARHFHVEGDDYSIRLGVRGTNRRRCAISPHEVVKIVEMQIAFACLNGYPIVPPPDSEDPFIVLIEMARKKGLRPDPQYL